MHQLFDEVVGTPPPSELDVRSLMRGERARSLRMRGVFALTVVGVVTAGVALLPNGSGATNQETTAAPRTFRLVVDSREAAAATAEQVSAALDAGLDAVGARWQEGPADLVAWEGNRFAGAGAVAVEDRTGGLSLQIATDYDPCPPGSSPEKACGPDQPSITEALLRCAEIPANCTEGRDPNGRRMVTRTVSSAAFTSVEVVVELADEWVLSLLASNQDGKKTFQAAPVLDTEALTTVSSAIAARIAP